jgi:outer membrane protein assembly factor BamB
MSHASIVPVEVQGVRMYVYCAIGGMVGVAAEGPQRGALLWRTTEWSHSVLAPSPVPLDGNRVLVTAGYGAGSMVFEITRQGEAFRAAPVLSFERGEFACEQQTPVLYEGSLYTVLPNDAGAFRQQAVCMTPGGEIRWRSGKEDRFGLGPFMVADGKLLLLDDSGMLTMAVASPGGYERLARAQVLDGRDAWAPMAMVDGRLLLRDSKRMVCMDLREES